MKIIGVEPEVGPDEIHLCHPLVRHRFSRQNVARKEWTTKLPVQAFRFSTVKTAFNTCGCTALHPIPHFLALSSAFHPSTVANHLACGKPYGNWKLWMNRDFVTSLHYFRNCSLVANLQEGSIVV